MSTIESFTTAFVYGAICIVVGVLVTLAVQALAGLNDGEPRR